MNPSCAGGDHAAIYLFLTATVIRDRFALRACIVHYGTTEADIRVPVATVSEVGAGLAARHDIDSHCTDRLRWLKTSGSAFPSDRLTHTHQSTPNVSKSFTH